ncbi:MAG TPA: homoserine O-acetyltransferase [Phycisphaerae bacterium]|nr:homoserine O-acetyltransferase [Phycisphaerae bacterium]
MSDELFLSSDSARAAVPLTHAQTAVFDQPLALELGGELPSVTVVYETYGKLNADRSNAVLICHALSGDSHVAAHNPADAPGWWDIAVGPGKCIDTDRYFVICPNVLGGCRGTTGPGSVNPATGRPWGQDFPTITVGDIVNVQRLLVERLGISRLLAVIGGSMGGHQALGWATRHSESVRGAIAVATSPRLTSQALAFDVVGRNAILRDANFRGGQYYDGGPIPAVGLAIARMLGHVTYLSREAMAQKFGANRLQPRQVATEFEKKFSVGSYLAYQGDKFVERFDANSYLALSMAMDLFDLGDTPEKLAASFAASRCRWLVLSFTSDWLFPPDQSRQMVHALLAGNKPVSYCNIDSSCGHDAFLLTEDLDRYGRLIGAFLENLDGRGAAKAEKAEDVEDAVAQSPTSIFHPQRLDYDRIVELLPESASVLDLGCGSGSLLKLLKDRGHAPLLGVELDERKILACVRRGLDVVQADLNEGLGQFADGQFDCVILSQTLQAVRDVERVLADMVRVGRRCVVSFPNFGYYKLRDMLYHDGRAPESPGVLHYKWYNSPNIRFLTVADFEDFCRDQGYTVHRRVCLDTEARAEVYDDPNRLADLAIFVLSR